MSGSAICKTTSNFIYAQLFLLGEGIPDPGDIFKAGADLFGGVMEKLSVALPGMGWEGVAAKAYETQNKAQELRAKLMGEIDNLTGNLISNQAEHISDTRDVLRAMKKMIDGVYKACKWLEDKLWFIGKAASVAMAIPAAALAMAVTGGALLYLTIMTAMNAASMIGLGGRLLDILKNLPSLVGMIPEIIGDIIDGIIDGIWPPKLPNIPIPGFPDIPGLPEFTWPPVPGIPDFNLPIPGMPEFQWPSIPGLPDFGGILPGLPGLGGGGIPGFPSLPGLPSVPNLFPGMPGLGDLLPGLGNLGALPSWTELAGLPDFLGGFAGMPALSFGNLLNFAQLPGVSSISSTMSQLTQLMAAGGGTGGGPVQMGSMAGQQAQMVSAQVQQNSQNDDQGAGAGSEGGERAPVDAGTGGQQGQGAVL